MEEKITYQERKEVTFSMISGSLETPGNGIGGSYAYTMFEMVECYVLTDDCHDMEYRIAGFLFEILYGEVTDEAEAWGTYWIYRYLNEPELRKGVPDPEILDEDIRFILSNFDVKFQNLEIYKEGSITSI